MSEKDVKKGLVIGAGIGLGLIAVSIALNVVGAVVSVVFSKPVIVIAAVAGLAYFLTRKRKK